MSTNDQKKKEEKSSLNRLLLFCMRSSKGGKIVFQFILSSKGVTHKLLCVRPHHQTRWSSVSALLTTQVNQQSGEEDERVNAFGFEVR